ncbi:uncharacterized protein LOC123562081 [Mercenaria mercenaria]|uniref:uncharacterized protein LOC123562081 n=1 Tax=Mercenaria mercenaria TaxID=6596 RepID=UPI00234EE250|nr:uncharacterized protein LOC123562081 [Mercenaria mercenaria]
MSEYILWTGNITGQGFPDFKENTIGGLVWYNFDMRRSLEISMIDNLPRNFKQFAFYCFYDDVKMSFLHLEAPMCNIQSVTTGSRIHMRHVRGRFITLVFESRKSVHYRMSNVSFEFYISNKEALGGELCNEDLGMADGSISDSRITSSSSLPQHLPSSARPFRSGWCHNMSDYTPWILVDLMAITTIEGVRLWNGRDNDHDTRYSSLRLYYGTRIDELQMYTDTLYKIDASMFEVQIFMIPKPIQTRFIKFLGPQNDTFGKERCLRFELQGCKLSGVPALNCHSSFDMFPVETEIKSENQSIVGGKNIEECNNLCQRNNHCSVASISDKGLCVQYMRSQVGLWKMNHDVTGHWFAKLCSEGIVELFPGFNDRNGEVFRNVQYISTTSIITSIGYPFSTKITYEYTWIVNFNKQRYVRFVFTNVSMAPEKNSCNDRLFIGTDLQNYTKGSTVDDSFNDIVFVIETSESLVIVTFIPCFDVITSSKFRAIITGEETPACFSIDLDMHNRLRKGRHENCNKPKMILTSLSILNLPFVNVEERFEIFAGRHHSIQIEFIDFYIVCPRDQAEIRSKFTVIEHLYDDKTYCNTDMPPKTIISKGSRVSIIFRKYEDSEKKFMRTEGFRLKYYTVTHSFKNMTSYTGPVPTKRIVLHGKHLKVGRPNSTKACSRAFKKCYNLFSAMSSWTEANSVCLELYQHLVTVHSRSELQYIHYLLRGQRYKDIRTGSENQDESFRAHIGLRRFTDKHRRKKYTWMNNVDVTFTAWKSGYPSFGDCTKTYFQPFNAGNTWESEDCTTGLAQYFICQSQIEWGNEMQSEIKEDICESVVRKEKQMVFSSYSGKKCQSWNHLNEDAMRDFDEELSSFPLPTEAPNHCADPSSLGLLWCYVQEPDQDLREPCFLQTANYSDSYKGCYVDKVDRILELKLPDSQTNSGYTCKHRCTVSQYQYAGTEYAKQCFCGHKLKYFEKKPDSECNMKCPGNVDEYCGGSWRISIYDIGGMLENASDFNSSISEQTSADVFNCSSGSTIPAVNVCDKTFDCLDFSDELSCMGKIKDHSLTNFSRSTSTSVLPARLEEGAYHLCGSSNEWISILAKCDGVIDCLDASDEILCSHDHRECQENEFSCGDGHCIQLSQVCDFIPDCTEANDEFCEFRPCSFDEYSCGNKQCIPISQRCNAVPDCIDNSDEMDCDMCRHSFHCDIDKCIPHRLVCDNYPDCDDGSDEKFCRMKEGTSCEDWWERGYHTSGKYLINGLYVYCDFSSMDTAPSRITFQLRDIDLNVAEDAFYTRTATSYHLPLVHSYQVQNMIYKSHYTCLLEVKSTCRFPYQMTAHIDKINYGFVVPFCRCLIETFEAKAVEEVRVMYEPQFPGFHHRYGMFGSGRHSYGMHGFGYSRGWRLQPVYTTIYVYNLNTFSVRYCDNITESTGVDINKYYTVEDGSEFSVSEQLVQRVVPVDITAGPITCSYEYNSGGSSKQFDCRNDNTTIPLSMVCLYDVDAAKYMTGCRSGEHLQNCGNVSCPENTVKCPGSYCIPLRFVCDGRNQCPGGEDEHDCACTDESREVILLIEDTSSQLESKTAAVSLAKQFFTSRSIVRLLFYKSQPRLKDFTLTHRVLEIQEERVSQFNEIKCRYKSAARDLLRKLQFSKTHSNGIVFIEDSMESSIVAQLLLSNLSKPAFSIYRIIKDYSLALNKPNLYKFVKDVHISRWGSLLSTGYRLFPEICTEASHVPCFGRYRCSSSKQCIPLEEICDGVVHCSNGDDERLCDFVCPQKCKCVGQTINCQAKNFNMTDVNTMSIHTRSADLSRNSGIKDIISQDNLRFPFMLRLNISSSEIKIVNSMAFFHINNLITLDIANNRIEVLPENAFGNLHHLTFLNLDGNFELRVVSSSTFRGLRNIRSLRLSRTKLKIISSLTFSDLNLQSIDISNNEIEEIENYAFNNTSVQKINFEGNRVFKFGEFIFNGVTSLQELRTPAFKFCCIRPCYIGEDKCYPSKNEFSSCEDLMRNSVLQAVLWLVGITSLFGNLGSIVYRLVYDRERLKIGYGIFVTNLAAADFLMGVYLIIIAVVDSLYRNRYIFMDDQWRKSVWCTIAGVLSTVSSEASVLFLCLITLDRLLVIKYPFGTIRFGPLKAYVCCGISWITAIALAVIPTIYTSYFQSRFYSKTGVCIALPLTRDKPPGWIYSVSIFVGLNFCTFIIVAFGQVSIFTELRRATYGMKKTQKSRRRDLQVARNLILVATTDFLCWFPVGVMGIMALNGHPISGDVYAWTAVFILPINSALNPILYTLTAIIGKKSFNPSIEEQSRTEVQREIGSAILQYQNLSSFVRMKREAVTLGKTQSIKEILDYDGNLPVATVTAVSWKLADYMRLLHESYVGIEKISEENTYIGVDKKKAKRTRIVIDSKASLIADERMMQENIRQFGILLRRMIAKCEVDRKTM